jgi:hypothetical protein
MVGKVVDAVQSRVSDEGVSEAMINEKGKDDSMLAKWS